MPRNQTPATETAATETAATEAKRGPGRPPVPKDETPSVAFKRLATFRVNRAIDDIATIGNLSGPAYEYTEEQVNAIHDALSNIVANTMAKFDTTQKEKRGGFSL